MEKKIQLSCKLLWRNILGQVAQDDSPTFQKASIFEEENKCGEKKREREREWGKK